MYFQSSSSRHESCVFLRRGDRGGKKLAFVVYYLGLMCLKMRRAVDIALIGEYPHSLFENFRFCLNSSHRLLLARMHLVKNLSMLR